MDNHRFHYNIGIFLKHDFYFWYKQPRINTNKIYSTHYFANSPKWEKVCLLIKFELLTLGIEFIEERIPEHLLEA